MLFATRIVRMFAYGFLSVVLVLYLADVGLSDTVIGVLLSLTLLGDTVISLWVTTGADRIGRRRMLILGAVLMLFAGAIFAFTTSFDEIVTTIFIAGPEQRTLPLQMFDGVREQISPTITAAATLLIAVSVVMLGAIEALRRRSARIYARR